MTSPTSPELERQHLSPEVREFLGYKIEAGGAHEAYYPAGGYDRMVVRNDIGLYAVADGVGIRRRDKDNVLRVPDVAAEAAVKAVEGIVEAQNTLRFENEDEARGFGRALMLGARAGVRASVNHNELGETTLALGLFVEVAGSPHLLAANAGDSRIQLLDTGMPGFPDLLDVTREQTVPGSRSTIYNCISSKDPDDSQDEIKVIPLQPKDETLIIASDGVTGDEDRDRLTVEEYVDAIDGNSAQVAADNLLALSLPRKHDDKSVIVVKISGPQKQLELSGDKLKELMREKVSKAAGFIARLGIGQKIRNIKFSGAKEKARAAAKSTGKGINSGARNAAAWTVVKSDSFLAVAKSKETYTNFQERLAKSFNQARDGLTKLSILAGNKIAEQRQKTAELTEEEKQRRRRIIGGVVGVAVVGAVAWRMWHGMESSGGGHHNFLADIFPQDSSDSKEGGNHHTGSTHHNHHGQSHHTPEHHHHGNQHNGPETKPVPRQLSLDQKGSSIWSTIDHAAEQRGAHLTDAQTYDLVSKTLHYNDLSWEDARHLPQGYDFRMPEEVRRAIEETTKKKKVH